MRRLTSNDSAPQLERWLAALLEHGTWIAASVVAIGLATALLARRGAEIGHAALAPVAAHIMTAGIALFILLPVARLIVMLGVFLHQRDYRFSAVAALVLIIVVAGSMFYHL